MIDKIIKILEYQLIMYNDLFRISEIKTKTIVDGKVNELEKITARECEYSEQIDKLEKGRQELTGKLFKHIEINEELTISNIVKNTTKENGDKLEEIKQKLNDLLEKLKNQNELNQNLINNSLEYIDFSINIMTQVGVSENKYGKDGQQTDNTKKNMFDMKL